MVFGDVVRIDNEESTYIEIDELRAFSSRKNHIKGEKFEAGDVVKAVIRRVYTDKGTKMELSRTSPKFLECLLEAKVPETKDEYVSIVKCARIPGERVKTILQTNGANIDPAGATVGVKGVGIDAVSKKLHNENTDCTEFSNEPRILIARALTPVMVSSVKIENEKAIVTLNSEQKSKAIGKSGINIRLAGMLSGYEIELNEVNAHATSNTLSSEETLENL